MGLSNVLWYVCAVERVCKKTAGEKDSQIEKKKTHTQTIIRNKKRDFSGKRNNIHKINEEDPWGESSCMYLKKM